MSLLVKVAGAVALIGAGSYFAYGYVNSSDGKVPALVKNVLSGLSADAEEKRPEVKDSKQYASTPLQPAGMSGREKLWAEEMAFRQKQEQEQAAHRAHFNAQPRRHVSTKRSCTTRRG